jgi:hypothetical protein
LLVEYCAYIYRFQHFNTFVTHRQLTRFGFHKTIIIIIIAQYFTSRNLSPFFIKGFLMIITLEDTVQPLRATLRASLALIASQGKYITNPPCLVKLIAGFTRARGWILLLRKDKLLEGVN